MTLRYLIVFVCGCLLGITAFATFQAAGFSLGTIGTLTTLFLFVMAVNTGSLTLLLLSDRSTEKRPRGT